MQPDRPTFSSCSNIYSCVTLGSLASQRLSFLVCKENEMVPNSLFCTHKGQMTTPLSWCGEDAMGNNAHGLPCTGPTTQEASISTASPSPCAWLYSLLSAPPFSYNSTPSISDETGLGLHNNMHVITGKTLMHSSHLPPLLGNLKASQPPSGHTRHRDLSFKNLCWRTPRKPQANNCLACPPPLAD